MENLNYPIRNRIRNLPACSTAHQPTAPPPNFTTIGTETRKLRVYINLRPYVKNGRHCADFRGTRISSTNVGKQLPSQISTISQTV
jgi:hypothetical protein